MINNKWFRNKVNGFFKIMNVGSIILSLITIVSIVLKFGFVLTDQFTQSLHKFYLIASWCFLITGVIHLVNKFRRMEISGRVVASVLMFLLFVVIIATTYHINILGGMFDISGSRVFVILLLAFISIFKLAESVVSMLVGHMNPSLILSISFFIIIIIGSFLLMLPNATYNGIDYIDALFISTSATCVTGLTSINTTSVFTPVGFVIIITLIQIGGLGVMTITSFFGLFFMGQNSLYNKFAVKDLLNSDSVSSLLKMLIYVFSFTVMFEAIGALFIWISIRGTLGLSFQNEIYFSVFHSISAFCNAGFSTFYANLADPRLISNDSFFIAISLLIIFGGIGFPILTNITSIFSYYVKRLYNKLLYPYRYNPKKFHIVSINSKIVIYVTLLLLLLGTLVIAIIEWNNVLSGFGFVQKLVQSFFNSVTPRTAGFSSVDMDSFKFSSIVIIIILMWIGGSSQSTAGGIKVNAFGVAVYALISSLKGRSRVEIMNREISAESVNRVSATIMLSIVVLSVSVFILGLLEPDVEPLKLMFEATSALGTVGLTMNLTPTLSDASKGLIIILMFIGRVGLLSFIMGFVKQIKTDKYRYPSDNIIVN